MHHSKPVKAWLADHKYEIEVFYLPSYSPELSPNEMARPERVKRSFFGDRPQARASQGTQRLALGVAVNRSRWWVWG